MGGSRRVAAATEIRTWDNKRNENVWEDPGETHGERRENEGDKKNPKENNRVAFIPVSTADTTM